MEAVEPVIEDRHGRPCGHADVGYLLVSGPGLVIEGVIPELAVVTGALMEAVEPVMEDRHGRVCRHADVGYLLVSGPGLAVEGIVPELAVITGALMRHED